MIIHIDQKKIEKKWAERKLDLFPFFYSLKVLLLSRESYLIDANKRLRESDTATWIQFLSSDDEKVFELAKEIIQGARTKKEDIIHLILYSLDKIKKKNYPKRLAKTIIEYDLVYSIGCLLGYIFIRPDLKEIISEIIANVGEEATKISEKNEEYEILISNVFDAIGQDIGERIDKNKRIQDIKKFSSINDELEIILMLYLKETNEKLRDLIEKEISSLGREIICCLHEIKFSYDTPSELYPELKKVIPYMGIFRLKEDLNFLNNLKTKFNEDKISSENDDKNNYKTILDEIILLIDLSIMLIEKDNKPLFETISNHDHLFIPPNLKKYIE